MCIVASANRRVCSSQPRPMASSVSWPTIVGSTRTSGALSPPWMRCRSRTARAPVVDRSHHLVEHARQRSADTRRRVRDAIRQLDRAAEPVTFVAVARAAEVSRAWLYRAPDLRSEIERLRRRKPAAPTPLPAAQAGIAGMNPASAASRRCSTPTGHCARRTACSTIGSPASSASTAMPVEHMSPTMKPRLHRVHLAVAPDKAKPLCEAGQAVRSRLQAFRALPAARAPPRRRCHMAEPSPAAPNQNALSPLRRVGPSNPRRMD